MKKRSSGGGRGAAALSNTSAADPDTLGAPAKAVPPRRSGRRAPRVRDGGAVFVEALVAAAIVAMVLAATLRVASDGFAQERLVQSRRMALLVAQSRLAEVGFEIPTAPGENAGFDGPFLWRIVVSPYDAAGAPNSAGALMRVSVTVRPRGGGGVLARLDSLRLGAG